MGWAYKETAAVAPVIKRFRVNHYKRNGKGATRAEGSADGGRCNFLAGRRVGPLSIPFPTRPSAVLLNKYGVITTTERGAACLFYG